MLTVTDLGLTCGVKFKYHQDYINRIRQIFGSRWNPVIQQWEIPKSSIAQFKNMFAGEIYWKTPEWMILNQSMPEYKINLKKTYDIPKLKIDMFNYQKYAYQFLMNKIDEYGFGFNTLATGLGKSVIAISCFYKLIQDNKASKCLILAKKSIKKQWVDEFKKFTDIDTIVDYIDYIPEGATKIKRKKMYDEFKKAKKGIIVTTYQSCLHDKEEQKKIGADILIIDEAHILRTVGGEMNKAVTSVAEKIKYKLLLTGTPIMSKPKDCYALMNICDKKYFNMSYKEFNKRYVVSEWRFNHEEEIGYKNIDELRDKCQDVMIRLTEHEVDIELPEIIEQNIKIPIDNTQSKLLEHLKGEQLNILDDIKYLDGKIKEFKSQGKDCTKLNQEYFKKENMSKGLIACRQAIADDPNLLNMTSSVFIQKIFKDKVPQTYKSSPKTDYCLELVETIMQSGSKVIIFSEYERTTRLLADIITKGLKINALTYSGNVCEQDRLQAIELFKNSDDYNVIIATNALAEGANMQQANYLINYDLPDTSAIKVQRTGRIRRASSSYKHGYVYNLISEGTIDEEKLNKIENQDNIFGSMFGISKEHTEALRKIVN